MKTELKWKPFKFYLRLHFVYIKDAWFPDFYFFSFDFLYFLMEELTTSNNPIVFF